MPHGSPAAEPEFSAFYAEELPGLLRFLGRLGAQPADTADAAQEAFIAVRMRWTEIRNPKAYLRRAARNELIALAERPRQDLDRAIRGCWIDLRSVEAAYARDEVQKVVRSLAQLPDRQRQVLAWFYDGYTVAEIAGELGMTQSSVRSNLRHARKKLRRLGVEEG